MEDKDGFVPLGNRYSSFAPPRYNCHAKWFVDGKDYFEAIAGYLEQAESEIFITDWSLNPELFLKRGEKATNEDRLDRILLRKARQGVLIYVLLWFETSQAIGGTVNSGHSMSALESLDQNIKVLRHPGAKTKVFWTHHQKTCIIDQQHAFIGGIDLCFGRYDFPAHPLIDDCQLHPEFPGKDYYNPRFQDFDELHNPFVDLINRDEKNRMPWHDIHAYVDREAARDIAANFVERWNHHLKKLHLKGDIRTMHYPTLGLSNTPFFDSNFEKGTANCQIIRSASKWSAGLQIPERSIQNAYLDLIEKSEHYIYIENQYFISVENSLTITLFHRLSKAIRNNETYRVFVLLPITPCGDWLTSSIRFVMKWQYDTICRSKNSLLQLLKDEFPNKNDFSDYITFHSLRKYDLLGNCVVADQIYIHSKLLIVDDRYVVIGSANYNDRSMCGDRDSEICVLVEDNEFIESKMNNKFFLASKYAYTLRVALFMEHLGLTEGQEATVMDPTCPQTFGLWRDTSNKNTNAFEMVSPITPSDKIKTIADYQTKLANNASHNKRLVESISLITSQVKGHLTAYPLNFLVDEKLDSGVVVEKLLPPKVFH